VSDGSRWQHVKGLFQAALERPVEARPAFLDRACPDAEVRQDVESLLASHAEAGHFLESPAAPAHVITPGSRLGPYEIAAPIGSGGMGDVYRARDTRLQRDVAVKVLPTDLAVDPDRRRRFEQEARAASALNHPNIVAVHDIGAQDGVAFIVTELLEGQSLAERVAQGPLPVRKALECAAQAARGLEAVHGLGIVHRDLKPANLFLTSQGQLKILDFGIAKLARDGHEAAQRDKADTAPTRPGLVIGTAGYMSPEQVRGESVDARSDQFALGCVLYELLTGDAPFRRSTDPQTMAAVVEAEPPPLAQVSPDVPRPLVWIVERCLAKDREDRYSATADLARDLELTLSRLAELREPLVGIRGNRPTMSLGSATVVRAGSLLALGFLAGGAFWAWRSHTPEVVPSARPAMLAVLPFENLSESPNEEYFSDGLTEELTTQLSRLQPDRLAVIARTSTMPYKKTQKRADEIGRELHADYLLEGSARREAERVRISVQLIRVSDQTHIWAESYQRELRDILELQSQVSAAVAREISIQLSAHARAVLASTRPVDPRAHELYLRGRHHWNKRTEEELRKSLEYFQKAIEQDPAYAPSYAALADAYIVMGNWGLLPPKQAYPRAKAAATQALGIDAGLAEARIARAYATRLFDWKPGAAEREFEEALAANPNYAAGHQWYAVHLASAGRFDAAIAEVKRAQELDPLSLIIGDVAGWILSLARRCDPAISELRKAIELDPGFYPAHYDLGVAYAECGMHKEALEEMGRAGSISGDTPRTLSGLAYVNALAGRDAKARKLLGDLIGLSKRRYVPAFDIAVVHAALGERDSAFDALNVAFEDRHPWLIMLAVSPKVDRLRPDPRFQALVRKLNVEER
jgi:eukaryotic-like serine/threonine-protein kinase